jgi:hypothetical protein
MSYIAIVPKLLFLFPQSENLTQTLIILKLKDEAN